MSYKNLDYEPYRLIKIGGTWYLYYTTKMGGGHPTQAVPGELCENLDGEGQRLLIETLVNFMNYNGRTAFADGERAAQKAVRDALGIHMWPGDEE